MNKSEKLLVRCEVEDGTHPYCPHGPMLYFYKTSSPTTGYFACSAFRDRKDCLHRVNFRDLTESIKKKRYPVETYGYKKLRRKIKAVTREFRNFCHTCNQPYVQHENNIHSGHNTFLAISDEMFANPTSFLRPLNNDKVEAQYFFDAKSLDFFVSCLYNCGIRKVICIGTPRLHAYLKTHTTIDSFLLDFDHRYFYFYDDDQFAWYNMCNHYFFVDEQRESFEKFMHVRDDENLAIFTDPPFGCRTEAIVNSIKQLTSLYRSTKANHKIPAVFWVYPYFCAPYICEVMPEMDMSDYKINYTNHESYNNGVKGRKLGSPVRLFTNVPLEMIALPLKEGYKHCSFCNRWTAKENIHCSFCKVCPSKNGDTYRHCMYCRICVKPNYIHCQPCRRCTQKENHNCAEYQRNIRCWICRQIGHNEYKCQAIKIISKNQSHICLICRQSVHNEQFCPDRQKYITESCFLGEYTILIKRRNKK